MHTVLPCRKLQNDLIVAEKKKTMLIHYAMICSEGKKYLPPGFLVLKGGV